jgi:hypothetical protein
MLSIPALKACLLLAATLAIVTACSKNNPPATTPATGSSTVTAKTTGTPLPAPTPFGARIDCPPEWTFYSDPQGYFSLCYPPGLMSSVGEGVTGGSKAFTLMTPQEPGASAAKTRSIVATIYWKPRAAHVASDPCRLDEIVFMTAARQKVLSVAGRQILACVGEASASGGTEPISVEVPHPFATGVVQVYVLQSGPDSLNADALIDGILSTLALGRPP